MKEELYPLLFEENFLEKIWGGHRLKPLKGLPADDAPVGESWEISAVPGHESIIRNGPLRGHSLIEVVAEQPEDMLGERVFEMYGPHFPLLFKLIDAEQDLSIQVHPDDALARVRHHSLGKTEMWYVIDAQPGASLYAGFNQPISRYEYRKRVEDGSICEVLARHYVKRGDVLFIPAGRVHAICGGLLLAEIQESSDITYRIFDYNRPGLDGRLRELHTELAEDAIDFRVYDNYLTVYDNVSNKPNSVTECSYFTMKYHNLTRSFHRKLYKYDSFVAYMCVQGSCKIESRVDPATSLLLRPGMSCLVPAAVVDLNLVPDNLMGETKILEVYIDNKHFNQS